MLEWLSQSHFNHYTIIFHKIINVLDILILYIVIFISETCYNLFIIKIMLYLWSLIFVVEDDPVFQEIFKKKLEEKKFSNIKLFSKGEDCLGKLNQNPAVVFLDFSLDGLNGLDVLKKIKSEKPKIKVYIVTVIEDKVVRQKCLKAGATNYFVKTDKGMDRLNRVVLSNRWRGVAAFIKKLLKRS